MAQTLSPTSAPVLTVIGGQPTTTSIDVARHFGKRHDTVLRAIANLDCSPEFTDRNFAVSEYTDSTGRTLPAYHLTRDGFVFLAMGFTGKDAAKWKEAYITAFNQMEAALAQNTHTPERLNLAYTQAAAVAQQVSHAVFSAVMAGDDDHWRSARWLFCLSHNGQPQVMPVPNDAQVLRMAELPRQILDPSTSPTNRELVELAAACNQQLFKRMAKDTRTLLN